MPEHDVTLIQETEYEQSFKLMLEREKLADNLRMLRRITWDLRAKISQLEKMFDAMSDLQADMKSLQDQINATAEELKLDWSSNDESMLPRQ